MKFNKSYIGLTIVVIFFSAYVVRNCTQRSKNNGIVKENRLNRVNQSLSNGKKAALYTFGQVPAFSLTNQNNEKIDNSFFKGKVYLVDFFFTTCPTICPKMTKNIIKIAEPFKKDKDFAVASFTINPSHDTPEVLRSYKERYGISHDNWHFLSGSRDAIYELSNKGFGIYAAFNDKAPGGFEHSGMFALVDKQGFIRSRYDSFGNPIGAYRGIDGTRKDETGQVIDTTKAQITALKQDIIKLLKE